MKSDALTQGLGAARMRYSGPFIDAIGWGLALEEAARPRSVPQWREVLFGQRAMAPQAMTTGTAGAQPLATTAKLSSIARQGQPARPAANRAADRIDPARGATAAMHTSVRNNPRLYEARTFPWKTLMVGVAVVALVGVGLRNMRPNAAARSNHQPTVMVISKRQLVAPGVEAPTSTASPAPSPRFAPADANAATPASETPAVTPQPGPITTETTTVAAPQPVVEPTSAEIATRAIAPGLERRIERFRAADVDGTGLTREQMAKNFPHLADRFDAMDTDHDGRVEMSELVAALQRMSVQAREAQ